MNVVIIVQIEQRLVGLLGDTVSDIVSVDVGQIQAVPRVAQSTRAARVRQRNGGGQAARERLFPILKEIHMKAAISISVLAIAFTASVIPASAALGGGPGHDHDHGHGHFSAGAPGNPKQPARTVTITMREADGKMLFQPNRIEVRRGEQVRFVLQNHGALEHEFVLGSEQENVKHAALMLKYPEMEHDDPNARRLKANLKGELIWRFNKRGEFEFACLIPGHREAGMHGKIVVK